MDNGCTPAYIAAQNGHDQTLRVLAELRADLNQVTRAFISMNGCLKATTRMSHRPHFDIYTTVVLLILDDHRVANY